MILWVHFQSRDWVNTDTLGEGELSKWSSVCSFRGWGINIRCSAVFPISMQHMMSVKGFWIVTFCIIDTLCIHKSCCAQYPGFGAQESDIVKDATDQPKIILDFTFNRGLADIFWAIYNFSCQQMNTILCDFHRLYYYFFCRLYGRSVWEGALEGVAHRLWEVCSPLYPTNQKTIIKYRFLLVSLFKLFWFQAKPASAERVLPSCAHIWSHPSTDHRCGGSGRHLKIFWLI